MIDVEMAAGGSIGVVVRVVPLLLCWLLLVVMHLAFLSESMFWRVFGQLDCFEEGK